MSKKESLVSEKLQKVMANAGLASRREAERWIEQGRVKVNGKLAALGDRVTDEDKIEVDGKKLHRKANEKFVRRVIAYHKKEVKFVRVKTQRGAQVFFNDCPN